MVMVIFLYVTRYGAYNEGPKPDLYIMLVTYYFNEVSVVNGKSLKDVVAKSAFCCP